MGGRARSRSQAALVLPLDRTAYFVGELVPLALSGFSGEVQLEALHRDGRVVLYSGPAAACCSIPRLAPGDYRLVAQRGRGRPG